MLKGGRSSKISGIIGLVAGLEGIISNFVVSTIGTANTPNPPYVSEAMVPYLLLALWTFSLIPQLYKNSRGVLYGIILAFVALLVITSALAISEI